MDTVLPSLFLQVILIASNAFFAMSEFAVAEKLAFCERADSCLCHIY